MNSPHHEPVAPVGLLRLWGHTDRRVDRVLSLLTIGLLASSRFALLASGPWEWDETIFARGMLDFSLAAHFPQPPGFPGLLVLGHLLLPITGDPYGALQLVSALASVALLWPLAILGRRVATPAVATAAALLVLTLPGPWLFSVRGFSTTAAVAPLLAAAAMLVVGLEGRRATLFTLLLTASFLIRPILLPTVALLWLIGAEGVRPRRRLLPGMAVGAAAIAVSIVVMARLEGGWGAFIEPFVDHASFHTDRLHRNTQELSELGLVTGVGGPGPAALLSVIALVGLGVWWRRVGPRVAIAWIALIGLTVAQLVMLQNRSYARYAVGVQMAAAPLIAGAATLAAPPVAVVGLLGTTVLTAGAVLPLVREQHDEVFGAWQATLDAAAMAADRGRVVVVEPEVHVFASYHWSVLRWQGRPAPPMLLTPKAPEPWVGIDGPWLVATVHPHLYWPSLTGSRTEYGAVSTRLRPLTQRRFLSAAILDVPPLPIGPWWTVEHSNDDRPFMWAGPGAELWLPPVPAGTLVGLELRPAPGSEPLRVEISHGGGLTELAGDAPATWISARTTVDAGDEPLVVRLFRRQAYPPGAGDERRLAVQLLDAMVRPPGAIWGGSLATGRDRMRLGVELDGGYGAESFGDLGRGVWLEPAARCRLELEEPGRLTLHLAAPRPTDAAPRVIAPGIELGPLTVDHLPAAVEIPVEVAGPLEIEILSEPYSPASTGSSDERELGVVLLGLEFSPAAPSDGWWSVDPSSPPVPR
jgi:hypothetical protein